MAAKRAQRAGVQDLWMNRDGTRSKRHGAGLRWRAVYVDAAGKAHTRAFRTKVDAQAYIDSNTAAVVTGTWVDPARAGTMFGDVAEQVMTARAAKVKEKTLAGYRGLLDTVILPRWKDVPVGEMTFVDVQAWVSGLSAKGGGSRFADRGLSASRVVQAHQLVGTILDYAVRAKMLPSNPARGVDLPRKAPTKQVFLTHRQVRNLADACDQFSALVLVLAYCGLRFGEAAALRVGDVDVKRRRIAVGRSVSYVTGTGLVESATKNHQARSVPVPALVVEPLRAVLADRSNDDLIWPGRDGCWLTNGGLRWVFDTAVEVCRENDDMFPKLTPHDLRHTTASLAISAGANVKVLQTLLGHETATMTLDRYGHLMPSDLDAVAVAMDAAARAV